MKRYVERLRELKPEVEYSFLEEMKGRRDNQDKIRRCQVVAVKLISFMKSKGIKAEQFARENNFQQEQMRSLLSANLNVSEEVMQRCADLIGLKNMSDPKQDKAIKECATYMGNER